MFHIFVATPAPVALGVGALFAGRVPFTVNQHSGMAKNSYVAVHNSEKLLSNEDGYHILNQRVSEFKHIEIEGGTETESQSVLIVLNFTGHRLPKPYPDTGGDEIITLSPVGSEGHIPLNPVWMRIAQEISTVISRNLDQGKAVSLLMGVPSSLAFMIGTILRTSSRVDVFYFNRSIDEYHRVFNLSELD